MIKDFILKTWFWIVLIKNKETLPKVSKIVNPKMKYEILSGAIYWEDEGLEEIRNHHLSSVFKYVMNHRMQLIVGEDNDVGVLRSKKFDRTIFKMVKSYFPNWVGYDESRCSYNSEFTERILRIKKVEERRINKFFNE